MVSQRARIVGELLPVATGAPDQTALLAKTPLIPESVRLYVQPRGQAEPELWRLTDDLLGAGPEVPARDPRLPPGTQLALPSITGAAGATAAGSTKVDHAKVFALDPESGELRFGDGIRGARPPFGATLRADYDYSAGRAGNVGVGAINGGPRLPAGIKVRNPIPTWGGADAQSVAEGERQITAFLRHHDRLVIAEDYRAITLSTPGVELGRVEVIPNFNPDLDPGMQDSAPGAVTLLVIPRVDRDHPDAPRPDRLLLSTICDFLEPRRLITSEIFLRGPTYKGVWVSVGITVVAGRSVAEAREATRKALLAFLAPLPASGDANDAGGWLRNNPVDRLQLWSEASRVEGVLKVNGVLLAEDKEPLGATDEVTMHGLELPRVVGIEVTVGQPISLDELQLQTRGAVLRPDEGGVSGTATGTTAEGARRVPVPAIREGCR